MTFRKQFTIGDRTVGVDGGVYVIAEIGSNHDQDIDQAKALIDAAAAAGADAAKFQSIRFDRIHLPERCDDDLKDLFRQIDLREEWYAELSRHCAGQGIHFLSSVTYPEAVDLLVESGVPAIKIASAQFDIHPEIVETAARTGLPLVMSTGLAEIDGVERMLRLVAGAGAKDVILLHCVSRYPVPADQVNLRVMQGLARQFDCLTGFSDHSLGLGLAPAAVALGAVAIEKHLTLDRNLPGPDHHFAITPAEFTHMVQMIREVSDALGDGVKPPLVEEERELRARITPKWITVEEVKVGNRLRRDQLMLRRCPGGIAYGDLDLSAGYAARRDIPARTPLEWSDVEVGTS